MQSRGLEIVVGLFICLGIAAVFLLTFRVSNLANAAPDNGYTVTAAFNNIGGLTAGAPVTMAGVQIGRVTGIKLNERTYQAMVAITIAEEYEIPKDSSASILTAGLLGSQYIGISPGASMKYLQQGDEFMITQGAIILEEMINRLFYALTSGSGEGS